MPSHETFKIKPIRELLSRYINEGWWVDPMAGNNSLAGLKNDINPDTNVSNHKEARVFLRGLQANSADGVLFDPPYSPRQVSECYRRLGLTVNMETTQASYWKKIKNEKSRSNS